MVAVNCFEPGGTCFCVSMGTAKAEAGYDLALTEILDGEHRLLVEVGTERGADVLGEGRHGGGGRRIGSCRRRGRRRRRRGTPWAVSSSREIFATCSSGNLEHPRWDEVAERCLI